MKCFKEEEPGPGEHRFRKDGDFDDMNANPWKGGGRFSISSPLSTIDAIMRAKATEPSSQSYQALRWPFCSQDAMEAARRFAMLCKEKRLRQYAATMINDHDSSLTRYSSEDIFGMLADDSDTLPNKLDDTYICDDDAHGSWGGRGKWRTYQSMLLDMQSLLFEMLKDTGQLRMDILRGAADLQYYLEERRVSASVKRIVREFDFDGDDALCPDEFSSLLEAANCASIRTPYDMLWLARMIGLTKYGSIPCSAFDRFMRTMWRQDGRAATVLRLARARLYAGPYALSKLDHAVARVLARKALAYPVVRGRVSRHVGHSLVNRCISLGFNRAFAKRELLRLSHLQRLKLHKRSALLIRTMLRQKHHRIRYRWKFRWAVVFSNCVKSLGGTGGEGLRQRLFRHGTGRGKQHTDTLAFPGASTSFSFAKSSGEGGGGG